MSSTVSVSQSLLSYALLITLLLSLWYWMRPLIENYSTIGDSIEQTHFGANKIKAAITARKVAANRTPLAETPVQSEDIFLPGITAAIAAANLQEKLKFSIRSKGGEFLNSRINDSNEHDSNNDSESKQSVDKIEISIEFRANIEQLTEVIYQIETQKPYLLISLINIRSNEPSADLSVLLSVYGFRKHENL